MPFVTCCFYTSDVLMYLSPVTLITHFSCFMPFMHLSTFMHFIGGHPIGCSYALGCESVNVYALFDVHALHFSHFGS